MVMMDINIFASQGGDHSVDPRNDRHLDSRRWAIQDVKIFRSIGAWSYGLMICLLETGLISWSVS